MSNDKVPAEVWIFLHSHKIDASRVESIPKIVHLRLDGNPETESITAYLEKYCKIYRIYPKVHCIGKAKLCTCTPCMTPRKIWKIVFQTSDLKRESLYYFISFYCSVIQKGLKKK